MNFNFLYVQPKPWSRLNWIEIEIVNLNLILINLINFSLMSYFRLNDCAAASQHPTSVRQQFATQMGLYRKWVLPNSEKRNISYLHFPAICYHYIDFCWLVLCTFEKEMFWPFQDICLWQTSKRPKQNIFLGCKNSSNRTGLLNDSQVGEQNLTCASVSW